MSYETKVILKMVLKEIATATSFEKLYEFVADASASEGVEIPTYQEMRKRYLENEYEDDEKV